LLGIPNKAVLFGKRKDKRMHTEKKKFILKRFTPYMGKKKVLLPVSLILSGLSAVLNIVPFVFVWFITRELLLNPQMTQLSNIDFYAWLALGCAILGVVIYFLSLLSSHLAAFHVEIGMQKLGMERIMAMPLGFFDQHSSGKIRKIVNDGAATTHGAVCCRCAPGKASCGAHTAACSGCAASRRPGEHAADDRALTAGHGVHPKHNHRQPEGLHSPDASNRSSQAD